MSKLRAVKGMNDILPSDIAGWHHLESLFRERAACYGFSEVRTPILEPTELFVRSIGEVTDIVEKEMYTFVDKGKKTLTMRPEGTASCVRAYLQHNVGGSEPVSKWFYIGPMYRRERPARGRYRQFFQAGCEVYGDPGPFVDAELIDFVVGLFSALGIQDLEVVVNSLGSGDTRERYRAALLEYLEPHKESLSEDSQRRLLTNPLRVLDSKAPQDQEIAAGAPSILDILDEEDQAHFDGLKASLDALGTPYTVDPRLVRGLDYYTRTLFEIRGRGGDLGAQNTLCGGGRYDKMIKELGGQETPAIGFAMGLERILLVMGETPKADPLDAFLVAQSPEARTHLLKLAQTLRNEEFLVDGDFRGGSMKSQMRRANKSGARCAIVIGQSEIEKGVVQLKDLRQSEQREVAIADLPAALHEIRFEQA